jgi:hypothetical protein
VYTIIPLGKDNDKYSENSKDGNKDEDVKTGGVARASLKRNRGWATVQINEGPIPQEEIIKTIRKLDAGRYSIDDKEAQLSPYDSRQVTIILNKEIWNERQGQLFEWSLAQVHRKESTNPKTGTNRTSSMTIYLKRAPRSDVDVVDLYLKLQAQSAFTQVEQHVFSGQDTDEGKQDFVAADRQTMPITYEHDFVHQNDASQEHIVPIPLSPVYDSNQQNQRNTTTSSYWSAIEQHIFREFLQYYGTDWHSIASLLDTKTHIMVCSPPFTTYNAV